MAKRFIPKCVEEITADWLTLALTESGLLENNTVRGFRVDPIGSEQGYMGILARLILDYERQDQALPATMIVKMPTQEWKNKMTGELFLNYERENRMYEELLGGLPVRTPRCYYSAMDATLGERSVNFVYYLYEKLPKSLIGVYMGFFVLFALALKRRYVLLFEDFGHLDYIDQRVGCSFEDAKIIMKHLGVAQSAYWENPRIDLYWLKSHSEVSQLMGVLYERGLPLLKKNFPEHLTEKKAEVFDWLVQNNRKLDNYILTRPSTLVHSDFRIDNIFFDRDRGEIAIVDWQTCYRGLGVADLAYFCLHGGSRPFTPAEIEELLGIYHGGLVEGEVTGYSLEDCLSDYKHGLMVALRYVMIILGALEIEKDPKAKKMAYLWFERMGPVVDAIDPSVLCK